MTELRALPLSLRDTPTTAGVISGVLVAGVTMAALTRPSLGRYVSEAVALVSAFGVAGMALFTATSSVDLDVVGFLRRPAGRLALVAFAAALVTVPFAIMTISGDGLRGLGDGLARAAALRSGDYETVVARGTGLVLVVGAMHSPLTLVRRGALILGAVMVSGSFLLTGHVRTHGPVLVVVVTALAHVTAAAAWFGGLVALGVVLRHARSDPLTSGRMLAAFARTMTAVLALVLAAGVGLAVLYLPTPAALVRTAYGEVLLVKLALVATVLVLSSANHLRLVPAAETGNITAVRVLRANIAAEQVLVATVLVVTAVLMRQNPGG